MPEIESIKHEDRRFEPSQAWQSNARIGGMPAYEALCAEAAHDHDAFWARLATQNLAWNTPFETVLDESNPPFYKWFGGGLMNVSFNCLDKQIQEGLGDKVAIVFEADDGQVTRVTYCELLDTVCRIANGLKSVGVVQGDRVVIYMPMGVEGIAAMQACARIGATHCVVFGGFSAKSLQERIVDVGAVAVFTADEQVRGGKTLPLKSIVDEALAMGQCEAVRHVFVHQRTRAPVPRVPGRDIDLGALMAQQASVCTPAWVESDHPLFVLYTSGSTGRPKGVQHSCAGYLLWAKLTM